MVIPSQGRVKVVYFISDIEKALSFEWIATKLNKSRFELQFVLIGKEGTPMEHFLREQNIKVYVIPWRSSLSSLSALRQAIKIISSVNPHVVHAHLLKANLIGLLTAFWHRVPMRIYTRHHSVIHHYYHKKGVLYDRLTNYLATNIIALCAKSREILIDWEGVKKSKVLLIPHGFDIESFSHVKGSRIQLLKAKYSLEKRAPLVGVISRFTEWKGIQYIIPAYREFLKHYPDACLVLANAYGDYTSEIDALLQEQLPRGSFLKIQFEDDVQALYQLFDLFIHVPIDPYVESFGQTYIEALAAGVPSIFTLSGIACDFIQNEQNALIVDYRSSDELTKAMKKLYANQSLKQKLIKGGQASVRNYDLTKMIDSLEDLYSKYEVNNSDYS